MKFIKRNVIDHLVEYDRSVMETIIENEIRNHIKTKGKYKQNELYETDASIFANELINNTFTI